MIWLLLTWLASPLLLLRAALNKRAPRRVLVIQTAKIGDFVATTAVFRALRAGLPGCEISALLHPVNLPLARGLDSIDHLLALRPGGYKGWAGKRWLLGVLAQGYDAVVILSPNLANMLAPLWCGIPRRVAVLADRRRGVARLAWPLLSHGEAHRTGQLFRSTALRALAGLGLDVDDACLALNNEAPRSPAADARAAEVLGAVRGPLVGLGLGAGNRMKALAPQQLSDLAGYILAATPATLVLVGTGADRDAAALLMQNLPPGRVLDTTGRLELDQLPALLAALDCYVGVDSGATYLADAAGVPVVDFMGPADADDQRPLGARAIVVRSAEPCAPCSHSFDAPYHCRLGTLACMKHAPLRVLADQVAAILATGAR